MPKSKEKHTSAVPQKRRWQHLQDHEEIRREDHSGSDADIMTRKERKKSKRKKRRVPVNELSLVKAFPSQERSPADRQKAYDSDNAIDLLNEYLDEQNFPASISPSPERNGKPTKANIGKPVTRIREDIAVPRRASLAREGFKFPSVTPRATKSPV